MLEELRQCGYRARIEENGPYRSVSVEYGDALRLDLRLENYVLVILSYLSFGARPNAGSRETAIKELRRLTNCNIVDFMMYSRLLSSTCEGKLSSIVIGEVLPQLKSTESVDAVVKAAKDQLSEDVVIVNEKDLRPIVERFIAQQHLASRMNDNRQSGGQVVSG